ncbi:MAG: glucose-6-phosphate isomerase [Deltaproteobacteria bacterium]|nr:glucose-6-phosphate isomerase [Deltaproteobacteria bacterium]
MAQRSLSRCSLNDAEVKAAEAALEELSEIGFSKRLLDKDPFLWKKTPADRAIIKNSLGWLDSPRFMAGRVGELKTFADEVRTAGFTKVVLLGMGGSSLAPLVLASAFGKTSGFPELIVLDSTDPDAIRSVESAINPALTLFIVSSKSGTTIEPLSFFEHFFALVQKAKGAEAGSNFIAITDPDTPLEGFYRKYGMRRLFTNPPDIGGRFSALSYFGLVPAALIGIDASRLIDEACRPDAALDDGIRLGATLAALAKVGRDKITFILGEGLQGFGLWIEQLIAESSGKDGKGLVPIGSEPIGAPKDYGPDRVFVSITVGNDDHARLLDALEKKGHPVIRIALSGIHDIGAEFLKWEIAAVAACALMDINPFDQPDVELTKKLALTRLARTGKKDALIPPGIAIKSTGFTAYFGGKAFARIQEQGLSVKKPTSARLMRSFLSLAEEGAYIGALFYFNPFDGVVAKDLSRLAKGLRDALKRPVQSGYGPRYLHSTGQLHKGGTDNGVFIIMAHESDADIPIGSQGFGFSGLVLSQACADAEALDAKGRPVVLLLLKDSKPATVKKAVDLILKASNG